MSTETNQEKDMDNTKIDSTITNIKLKQCEKISEWEKLNPTYREDPQLLDEWQNMIAGITENCLCIIACIN